MMSVSVVEVNGRIAVVSPYSVDFVSGAKTIGGKWDGGTKAWTFDARDGDRVAALVESVYGITGDTAGEAVVTVTVEASEWSDDGEITILGQVIARRRSRDESVRLSDGVVVTSGSFRLAGGSCRYPVLGENRAVLEIRDVPVSLARRMAECVGVSIVEADTVRESLIARRIRLLDELATIDAELALVTA